MKLNRQSLINTFSAVASLAGKTSTLPILNTVRLTLESGGLRIMASDIDCFASAVMPCEVSGEMDLCVSAKVFGAVIRGDGDELELKAEKELLRIESGGTIKLATLSGVEHVPWPKDQGKALGVNVADLAECIESVAWAASDKPEDGVMQNVWLKTEAKRIQCAASDRKRLGYVNKSAIAADAELCFDARFAGRVCESLRVEGAAVAVSENFLLVESEHRKLAVKLFDGRYPNVAQIVQQEWKPLGEVAPGPLIEALEVVRLVAADDLFPRAYLDITPQGIAVRYKGQSGECNRFVPARLSSEAEISFNGRMAISALQNTRADGVKLKVAWIKKQPVAVAFEHGDRFNSIALMADKK